jgi:DNA polymerase III subunit delta
MSPLLASALRDIGQGKVAPFYVVSGEEPFQGTELLEKLRAHLVSSEGFNYEVFDAQTVLPADFIASLDMLSGLFDAEGSKRLVVCRRFEKASSELLEALSSYWSDPSSAACLLIFTEKMDRRKAWTKEVEKRGVIIEVNEPYERDWPRWKPYFEKRISKAIQPEAWDRLVLSCSRSLSLVASDCEKLSLFVGDRNEISLQDVAESCGSSGAEDIFQLSEDVVARRCLPATLKFHRLLQAGESEIKVLSILVRHFRQVDLCLRLWLAGVKDPKTVGPQIGVPPFFVPKIQELSRLYTRDETRVAIQRLAECDYRLKRGEGSLWTDFLVPHFGV